MAINSNFLINKFNRFLWYSGLDDSSVPKRWTQVKYSSGMKQRLGMFSQAVMSIPYGCLIFSIADFTFSIGSKSVVAEKLSDIGIRSKWVYFNWNSAKNLNHFLDAFSIPKTSFLGASIENVTTSQAKKFGYKFKFPLENLILFAHRLERYRPEVSMAIRKAYFDKESNPTSAAAQEVAKIGYKTKKKTPKDVSIIKTLSRPLIGFKTPTKKFSFREYQLVGVSFWRASGGRAMIGDQMGIGKTVQAIGALKLAMEDKTILNPLPALVVCPSSVISQWVETIEEWLPGVKPITMIGSGKKPAVHKDSILITTYETMRRNKQYLLSCGFRMAIFDESHLLKNAKSGRTKIGTDIGTNVPFVLLLTGTPMEKSIKDLWAQFHILSPKRFPNMDIFLQSLEGYQVDPKTKAYPAHYPCDTAIMGTMNGVFARYAITDAGDGQTKIFMRPNVELESDLQKSLSTYMIRRLKNMVLDLPPKTRTIIKMPLDAAGRRLYESYEKRAIERMKQIRINRYVKEVVRLTKENISNGMPRVKALASAKSDSQELLDKVTSPADAMLIFTDLNRQIGMLKTPMVIKKLADFIRDTGGREPILVFADQHRVINEIQAKMSMMKKPNGRKVQVRSFTGKQNEKTRKKIKEDFAQGKIDILILNKAGNVGLNLQRASYVLFAERYWNPTDEEQAEDRAHRSGQKNPVTVYYPMIPDTIEEQVLGTIDRKREAIANTIGNQSYKTSVKEQRVQVQNMMKQLHKRFDGFIGKVRVPEKEIKLALRQSGLKI